MAITYVLTLSHVAEMLGEDLELLQAIVSNSDNTTYGSIISVIEGDDASVSALTDDGIGELTNMLSEARRSPATWAEFLDDFELLADPDAIARIKANLRGNNRAVTVHSMSRRGNCHDNAVAESFFNLLKRERIGRRVYRSRDEARQDVFDYIEMFYNPKRKHVRNGMLSPSSSKSSRKSNPRVSTKLGAIRNERDLRFRKLGRLYRILLFFPTGIISGKFQLRMAQFIGCTSVQDQNLL
jgi:hypothetical protein